MKNTTIQSLNKSKGLSIIELMVSMTIGLFLIGGLMGMYLGSRTTDKTRTELSDIEANARIALQTLRQSIEHAGYRTLEDIHIDKPFQTSAISNSNCRDGKPLVVNSKLLSIPGNKLTEDFGFNDRITTVTGADHPDTGVLYLDCAGNAYNTDTSTADANKNRQIACSTDKKHKEIIGDTADGMPVPNEAKIYNYFTVKLRKLVCYGSRTEDTAAHIIADNIHALQFRYGVVIDGKTIYKPARFLVGDDWEAVTSVQVAILVASEKEVLPKKINQSFVLLGSTFSIGLSKKMYKVYNTTINLENRRRRGFE